MQEVGKKSLLMSEGSPYFFCIVSKVVKDIRVCTDLETVHG